MFCPLMSKAEIRHDHYGRKIDFIPADCQQENCAWWIAAEGMCAVTQLGLSVRSLDQVGVTIFNSGS